MDWKLPASSGFTSDFRQSRLAQPMSFEICVNCCRPAAEVVSQEIKGRHPVDAFVVGSSPEEVGSLQRGGASWALVHRRCNNCQTIWYSYIVYTQAYDCRVDDPLYSPKAVAQRSRANSAPYTAASTPHRGSFRGAGADMASGNLSGLMQASAVDLPFAGPSTPYSSGQFYLPSDPLNVDTNSLQPTATGQDWTLYDTDADSRGTWSPLGVPVADSRERASSDGQHKRGPNFDPHGYRRTRDRGACEMHRRNKKACRHPEHDDGD